MIDSVSDIVHLAIAFQQQKTVQQIDVAVFNKIQDVQELQGEAVLQLLDSAVVTAEFIDVYV